MKPQWNINRLEWIQDRSIHPPPEQITTDPVADPDPDPGTKPIETRPQIVNPRLPDPDPDRKTRPEDGTGGSSHCWAILGNWNPKLLSIHPKNQQTNKQTNQSQDKLNY